MAYSGRPGRRPQEAASKFAHSNIVHDAEVKDFLSKCVLPPVSMDIGIDPKSVHAVDFDVKDHIKHIVAFDGGYTEVPIRKDYPSCTISFFQFGALTFRIEDLNKIGEQQFIDPDDIQKLKEIQRLKFALPVRSIKSNGAETLVDSVRLALFEFFKKDLEGSNLAETLRWLIYEEYQSSKQSWVLSKCPSCEGSNIELKRADFRAFSAACPRCAKPIFITDVFRLHEAVDNELGAGGVLGYVTTTLEQMLLVHFIRLICESKPALLDEILFVKDGPLAFFGQTANMHKPMLALVSWLFKNHNLKLVGLEKSGAFVEHAQQAGSHFKPGTALILNNDYIYRYIIPGQGDPSSPYGKTTYYGNKVIYRAKTGGTYVATIPVGEVKADAKVTDLKNLDEILVNLERLRCDMYDNALIPVALANKLVSLANQPSAKILQRFAAKNIG